MLLRLPANIHIPIKIRKCLKQPGEEIERDDPLFSYEYTADVTEGSRDGTETIVKKQLVAPPFTSRIEGTLKLWKFWEGDVISQAEAEICEIDEPCPHTVQYMGMCDNCGKDMTIDNGEDAKRVGVQQDHNQAGLLISQGEATRVDEETKRHLLANRKLALVCDLDQTVIQAACDSTIGEWMKDPENPNYEAVKDIQAFELLNDKKGKDTYYIKKRPGLDTFLENMSRLYELHIYTMGTRAYAEQVSNIVDPKHNLFGERILSRTESGSMVAKNLARLFPIDTKMVVIIDDRGDVWKWNPNLMKVTPLLFFPNVEDINASFLPKTTHNTISAEVRFDSTGGMTNGHVVASTTDSGIDASALSASAGASTIGHIAAMSAEDDPALMEAQAKQQEETIHFQKENKPLLQLQKKLDEAEAADEGSEINGTSSQFTKTETSSSSSSEESTQPTQTAPTKSRHGILNNNDNELIYLESALTKIHKQYFDEYDKQRYGGKKGGRVGALSGKRKIPVDEDTSDLKLIPDIKNVMPKLKERVLEGIHIVFSGIHPLGADVNATEPVLWSRSFGATIQEKIDRHTTHVIAARIGTAKVKQAVRRRIPVVELAWLYDSMIRWQQLDTRPYLLDTGSSQFKKPKLESETSKAQEVLDREKEVRHEQEIEEQGLRLSDSEDETPIDTDADLDLEPKPTNGTERTGLKLKIKASRANGDHGGGTDSEAEPFEDDGSPVTLTKENWSNIDDELKEFLGSDIDSESDNDSVTSKRSSRKKRSRDNDSDAEDESPRKRVASGTGLRAVSNVGSASTGSTPQINGDIDGGFDEAEKGEITDEWIQSEQNVVENIQQNEDVEEDSDDELERLLEQEMESAGDSQADEEGFMGVDGGAQAEEGERNDSDVKYDGT